MSKSRFGGLTTRRLFSVWQDRKAEVNAVVPETIEQFDYTTAKGIWGLPSTTQFPKYDNISSITMVGYNTSGLTAVSFPAGCAVGDIAILMDFSSTVSGTVPVDWTLINRSTTTGIDCICSYKILTSQDISTASVSGMTSGTQRKTLLVFRPNRPIKTVNVGGVSGQATTAMPNAQVLNLSTISAPVIGIVHYVATSNVQTRYSEGLRTTEINNSNNQIVRYVYFNRGATPTNGTIVMSDGGTNSLQSFYIELD